MLLNAISLFGGFGLCSTLARSTQPSSSKPSSRRTCTAKQKTRTHELKVRSRSAPLACRRALPAGHAALAAWLNSSCFKLFAAAEIILLNKQIIVYMYSTDVYLYVGGDQNENELILATMLSALYDTLDQMLRCAAITVWF